MLPVVPVFLTCLPPATAIRPIAVKVPTLQVMEFRFNYSYTQYAGGAPQQAFQSRTGADFIARSNLPSIPNAGNAYVADFMLLRLNEPPPLIPMLTVVGWNRNIGIWSDESYDKYIGFHHPAGDLKKLAFGSTIYATGTFNQSAVAATHWDITFHCRRYCYTAHRAAVFFEKNGLLIGDLSGGPVRQL